MVTESEVSSENAAKLNLWKALGPGILVACAAVGGSHLVWSTRAGAEYGWSLVWLILVANLLKYPFFLYGQKYTAATGESLLAGYLRHGVHNVWIFLIFNVLTGTINIAGVAMLSAALLQGYGITFLPIEVLTVGLMVICALLLLFGQYKVLDSLAKLIIITLSVITLVAVIVALPSRPEISPDFVPQSPYHLASFAFLISLLGWMPAPLDLSAWSSLWIFSRKEQTGHFATVRETTIDFYIGYVSAVVLAVLFVALGALVMYGTGETFEKSGIKFSNQLVSLYTSTIGDWSRLLIVSAGFITMFSTTLTCVDGYPRSLAACCMLIGRLPSSRFKALHVFWIVITVLMATIIMLVFVKSLLQLLAFAAVVSFLTSPVLAIINYVVMSGENVPEKDRPGTVLKVLSLVGILFFSLMALGYLYVTFIYDGA